MKRVVIIGSPGTGKSTFARKLAAKTNLPLIHLDFYYHDKNKNYYVDKNDWITKVSELARQDEWIIDGNYSRTLADRMRLADTIIYFDLSRYRAFLGVAKRRVEYHDKKRADMPDDWKERANVEFFKYVWNFRKNYRVGTLELLNQNKGKQIIVFKNHKQTENYLNKL